MSTTYLAASIAPVVSTGILSMRIYLMLYTLLFYLLLNNIHFKEVIYTYKLIKTETFDENLNKIECGHLICDEISTLRLNDVLRESGDYIFQIKIKPSSAAIFNVKIQSKEENILLRTSWNYIIKKFTDIDTTTIKFMELTFTPGEYWFYNTKLETGSIPSSWSLSIDDLSQKIDLVESNFTQRMDSIEMSISSKQDAGKTAIRYIRDWLNGSNMDNENRWVECQVIKDSSSDNGKINLAESATITAKDSSLNEIPLSNVDRYNDSNTNSSLYVGGNSGRTCIEMDLGKIYTDIDYIKVWHYYADNRVYNHQLQVSSDGVSWVTLYDSNQTDGYKESENGYVHTVNSTYITTQLVGLKVDTDGIKGQVESIDGRVTSTETSIDSIRSTMVTDRAALVQTQEALNQLQRNYDNKFNTNDKFVSETKQTLSGLSETYAKISDVNKQITNIETTAYGWQGLFAILDMYNDPTVQTNVSIDINGVTVTNPKTGQITKMRIDGFSGWNNNDKIFWIEGDTTKTRRLLCEKGWDTDVIKMTTDTFTINGQSLSGVSFVKSGGTS